MRIRSAAFNSSVSSGVQNAASAIPLLSGHEALVACGLVVVLAALNLRSGERVLGIGCGGGAAAYDAGRFVGPSGRVDAIDISADQIEQDAREIATTMRDVITSVLADGQVRQRGVAFAGLATQRSSVVAWDRRTGEPLAPLLSWQDRRAAELRVQGHAAPGPGRPGSGNIATRPRG